MSRHTYSSATITSYASTGGTGGAHDEQFFAYREEDDGEETKRMYHKGVRKGQKKREEQGKNRERRDEPRTPWEIRRSEGAGWTPFSGNNPDPVLPWTAQPTRLLERTSRVLQDALGPWRSPDDSLPVFPSGTGPRRGLFDDEFFRF